VNSTVLVCDDAVFMRTMISDILMQAGLDVVGEAESGSEAGEEVPGAASRSGNDGHHHAGDGRHRRGACDHEFDPQARVLMCSAMGQQALVAEAIQRAQRISS
jgi:two-component system chemotaxis response regulator CheY